MEQPQDADPPLVRFVCDDCLDPKLAPPGEVYELRDPWGQLHARLCDGCAEARWERHCTDYDAPGPAERAEQQARIQRDK